MKSRIVISGLFMSLFFFMTFNFSCKHESEIIDTFPEICFEAQVLPVLQNNCALSGCHDGLNEEANYKLTAYPDIIKAVDPGNPSSSPLYTSLIDKWSDDIMPPSQPLSLENRTIIRIWIEQGALETTCTDSTDTTGNNTFILERACFQRDIFPVIQSSCAFAGCHDDITAADDVILTSYNSILNEVIPNDAAESKLYQKLVEDDINDRMPPVGYNPLTQAQIDSIYAWINYGALDEDCGTYCDTASIISYSGIVGPMIVSNCKGCHTGSNPSGGIKLDGYNDVSAIVQSGQFEGVLRAIPPYPLMPPAGTLTECQIRQIEIWIAEGYINN